MGIMIHPAKSWNTSSAISVPTVCANAGNGDTNDVDQQRNRNGTKNNRDPFPPGAYRDERNRHSKARKIVDIRNPLHASTTPSRNSPRIM